jgi:hypothetical protein
MIQTMGLFRFDERPRLWFWAAMAGLAAGLMYYAQTMAFTGDESFHLVAAQMIKAGFRPYLDFCFPQTPLNAYWNAFWFRVLPESWRTVHAVASLESSLGVAMAADFVYRRWEPGPWRLPAALTAGVLIGSNNIVVEYGTLGQAYAVCLFLAVAAFRATTAAVRGNTWLAALAGALAGAGAASSLLSAPVAPVLLVWMLWNSPSRQRWLRGVWFVCAAVVPFAPVVWLFAREQWVVWFNLAEYHLYYRQIYWPDPFPHDISAITAWLDDPQAMLLGLLAVIGLVWLVRLKPFDRATRAELYLCAMLSAGLFLELAFAHPTFQRYFITLTPFVGILAVAGLYAIGSRALAPDRPFWPCVVLCFLSLGAVLHNVSNRGDVYSWKDYEAISRKVEQVTPKGDEFFCDGLVYFLTKHRPLPGMEFDYSHKLNLPPAKLALLHVMPDSVLQAKLGAGVFYTATTCDDDTAKDYKLEERFEHKDTVSECSVFWGPKGRK